MESAATIVQSALNILSFLEDNCPDVMKRHSLSTVHLTKKTEAYFTKLNANKELLNNPYRFFNKSKFINYTIFSNGDSLRFTFTQKERKTYNRPSKAEFEPRRASGNYDFHNSEKKRKSNVHRTANPQRRLRLPAEQQPNYRDPDENLFFVAIDPNHSNLYGWTAGSFRNSAPVFERSGLLLNRKERRLNHPPPLTQATPNTYSAQSFQEYLIEISLPYVSESEEEPEYSSIMSGNLQRGARKKLRRNKFDFFIRRQKRITSFINKIKRWSEGRNTIVWFGNGGGGPSRQSVKSPRKRFLKQIKKHFESLKVGDEFMTSATVNCCKVIHRKSIFTLCKILRGNSTFKTPLLSILSVRMDQTRERSGSSVGNRTNSVTYANIESFSSLQEATQLALFESLADQNSGIVTSSFILSKLETIGIYSDDPRIIGILAEEDHVLSFSDFVVILSKSCLFQRALDGQLIIPEWKSFTSDITDIFNLVSTIKDGEVAKYIPQLARVDPDLFAVSICSVDGQRFSLGNHETPFSIQSCSKPVTYCIALEQHGLDTVHRHVAMEPSGRNFNELVLNCENLPHNAMINAGAIMVTSLIKPELPLFERFRHVINTWGDLAAGSPISFDNVTFLSESATADRNFCLAYMMKEAQSFPEGTDIQEVLSLYLMFCGIQVTSSQVASVAATLANNGVCPLTNKRVFEEDTVRDCLSTMASNGLYDASGQYFCEIGIPTKSSVSGCLMLVIPGVLGAVSWSPPLDSLGNSIKGTAFAQKLCERFSFHVFDSVTDNSKVDVVRKPEVTLEDDQIMLLFAVCVGDFGYVQRLVAKGCNVNFLDTHLRSPLHIAACHNQLDIVEYLVNHDADASMEDCYGNTPLQDAIRFGHKEVAEILKKCTSHTSTPKVNHQRCPSPKVCSSCSPKNLIDELGYKDDEVNEVANEDEVERISQMISLENQLSHHYEDDTDINTELIEEVQSDGFADYFYIPYSLDLSSCGKVLKKDLLTSLERTGILWKCDIRFSSLINELDDVIDYEKIEELCAEVPALARALIGNLVVPDWPFTTSQFREIFETVNNEPIKGKVADYIDDLARKDPSLFSAAVCSIDGQRSFFGNCAHTFTLQHCSNVISFCLALEELGEEEYFTKVGREPSGLPSDCLALDFENKPHNPFINSGAMFSASVIAKGEPLADRFDSIRKTVLKLIGCFGRNRLIVDHVGYSLTSYLAELKASDRNYALLYLMREKGVFESDADLDEILKLYLMLCSIEMNTASLSVLASVLANEGVCPFTSERLFKPSTVRNCLALMNSSSMYNFSGAYMFDIGLPGVCGSSGCMMIVIPSVLGFAVYSPPLNKCKISEKGLSFCRNLLRKYHLHPFEISTSHSKKVLQSWRNTKVYKDVAKLCHACSMGEVSEVRQLLRERVDVNLGNYDSRTALHCACAAPGNMEIVNILLENGADPNLKDDYNQTAIDVAIRNGHDSYVPFLKKIIKKELLK
ncbi:hypothetical protein P9112_013042 [Eukaryota sp. TZLM1-RC]